MDQILEWGIELIAAVQVIRSPLLDAFFQGVTFLGDAEFYLLLAPIFIWCVDYRLGARLGIVFLASSYLNDLVKNLLAQPRPCALEPEVCVIEAEGYGIPSGHSQNAVVFWGIIAHWVGQAWAWAAAIFLMVLIGFSRVYLGVHFPTDVLAGWAIGIVILAIYIAFGNRIERWLGGLSLSAQLTLALAIPLLLLAVHPTEVIVQVAGALTGLAVGIALTMRYLEYDAGGPLWKRAARFLVGVAIVAAIFFGLRLVSPAEGQSLHGAFRYVRYSLVGLWISAGAPWLFLKVKLAAAGEGSV